MHYTKKEFSVKDFFSKCEQIHRKLLICLHLRTKYSTENSFFVQWEKRILSCPYITVHDVGNLREALVRRYSVKKMFLKRSQTPQDNTCARVSFIINLQSSSLQHHWKEALAQVLSCAFYVRRPILEKICERLLVKCTGPEFKRGCRKVVLKKLSLKNSKHSQENPCARVSFLKSCRLQIWREATASFYLQCWFFDHVKTVVGNSKK